MAELYEVCRSRGTVCPAAATVQEAVERLERSGQAILPVIDPEGRLVGVLTEDRLHDAGRDLPVHAILPGSIPCCRTWDPLSEAVRTMQFHGLRHLPVVDSGSRLAGIVSLKEIMERSEP